MKTVRLTTLFLLIFVFAIGIAYAGNIEKGKALFNSIELGTNGKSCATCHPDARGVEKAGSKKTFNIMGKKQDSLEDAVNFCIKMALMGKPLKKDSQEMEDIVSYIKRLEGKKK
jgi:cytochrome c